MCQHTDKMKQFDQTLNDLERSKAHVEEQRREYINRHGLNKPVKDGGYTKG